MKTYIIEETVSITYFHKVQAGHMKKAVEKIEALEKVLRKAGGT